MQPIEATPIRVEQPAVPPCELWVAAIYEDGEWDGYVRSSEKICRERLNEWRTRHAVRLFKLTDAPPAPIDLAAVAEAWDAFRGERNSPGRNDVAAFVAHLLERGVPREGK